MSLPSISFVIPYYAIEEELLRRSLDSLQRLALSDWEAWVIDDGSPTRVAEQVLNDYDKHYYHYIYKENGGVGSARNLGVSLATKDYIQFLDPDDYLYASPARMLIGLLGQLQPEMLSFNFETTYDDTSQVMPDSTEAHVLYRGGGAQYMAAHNIHGTSCCAFYKRNLLLQVPFSGLSYHEDEEFTPRMLIHVRDLVVTDAIAYAYYQRRTSRSHHALPLQKERRYDDLVEVITRLHTLAVRQDDQLCQAALERRADMLSLSLLYTLVYESPSLRFTRTVLDKLQAVGFYPLRRRHYNMVYTTARVLTYYRLFIMPLNIILRHFKR